MSMANTRPMRACDDTLRVARTIADLAPADSVHAEHVAEAPALHGENASSYSC
ncbi:MAG: hypothetical protein ACE5G3_13485 [Gammaproteobacteria bacterium]